MRGQSARVTGSVTLSQCLASRGSSVLTCEVGRKVRQGRHHGPSLDPRPGRASQSLQRVLLGWLWLVRFQHGAEFLTLGPGRVAASLGRFCTQRTFRKS